MKYLVSYDLVGKDPDYGDLWKKLKEKEATQVLKSQWIVESPSTKEKLAQSLAACIKGKDRLLVNVFVPKDAIAQELMNPVKGVADIKLSTAGRNMREMRHPQG